jgi:class 3 adenylate cyclase
VDDATTDLGERARRLELVRPRDLTLRGERRLSRPYRARFEGRPPEVEELGDTVAVTYPRLARKFGAAATITLDASVSWRIEATGPVRRLTADLGVLTLLGFEVTSGAAAEVTLTLPPPSGEVPVRLAGGAASVTIHRPAGVPVRVRVGGGASRLRLDGQRFRAVGGETLWDGPGFEDATDRYVVEIRRGARDLTVDTLAAVSAPAGRSGRSLATVLFTDIVGSTERARELGDRRWREVLDAHDSIARRLVGREGGDLVKTTGDGVLAIFEAPGPAIRCAVSLREELREHGVEIRTGLHTGEVEHRGADVGGIAVHTAARILDVAGPGEILVSRTVRDLVAGSGLTLEDRGTHALRGVGDDWRLYAIAR